MTEPTAPQDALLISPRLSELLLWLMDANEHEVAKEVIDKPWHFEDLAQAHAADPHKSAGDILDA